MKRSGLLSKLEQLADHYGWLYESKKREARGLHRGVGVSVVEENGQLHFLFFAPNANIGDEILQHFQGFHHFAAADLPLSWISGRTEDDQSCVLCLDGEHSETVGEERFLAIPDLVAQDFHDHGASEEQVCQQCGQQPAVEVKRIKYALVCLCPACAHVPMTVETVEVKPPPAPVLWFSVLPRLLLVALVGASAWGLTLHWLMMRQKPVGLIMVMLPHFGFGVLAAALVCRSGTGITWTLRLTVAAVLVLAVLAGNIGAFQAVFNQRLAGVSWDKILEVYFKLQLPHGQTVDLKCMVASGLGALVGLTAMKTAGAKYLVVKPRN